MDLSTNTKSELLDACTPEELRAAIERQADPKTFYWTAHWLNTLHLYLLRGVDNDYLRIQIGGETDDASIRVLLSRSDIDELIDALREARALTTT